MAIPLLLDCYLTDLLEQDRFQSAFRHVFFYSQFDRQNKTAKHNKRKKWLYKQGYEEVTHR